MTMDVVGLHALDRGRTVEKTGRISQEKRS
jgi:hypothetical protein